MSCPHCRDAALSKANFCRHCGSPITLPCAACGTRNPPGSQFCGDCGSILLRTTDPAPLEQNNCTEVEKDSFAFQGERRHLTILFTDLTGYSRMMEKHDPEDVQALMASIFPVSRDRAPMAGA